MILMRSGTTMELERCGLPKEPTPNFTLPLPLPLTLPLTLTLTLTLPLTRCGLPKERRFSFYDQVHTPYVT